MITLAIIIALSFVLLFGASVRRRIKRDRDGGLLDVSCNHCGKWIDASGGAHICRFRVAFKLNARTNSRLRGHSLSVKAFAAPSSAAF